MHKNAIASIRGFTLLEIMLATSLGSCIVVALLVYCSLISKFYLYVNEHSQRVENRRFVVFFLLDYFQHLTGAFVLPMNKDFFSKLKIKRDSEGLQVVSLINNQQVVSYIYLSDVGHNMASLFLKQENKPRIEIARGIDHMKSLYGIKCPSSNNICNYFNANQIVDWMQVRSVEVTLTQMDKRFAHKIWSIYVVVKPYKN